MANRMLETGVEYNMGLVQAVTDMSYTATMGLKRLEEELDRARAAETEALKREAEKDARIKALADAGMALIEAIGIMTEADAEDVTMRLADALPAAAEQMILALRSAGRL